VSDLLFRNRFIAKGSGRSRFPYCIFIPEPLAGRFRFGVYVAFPHKEMPAMPSMLDKELKKGSTEMLIMALVEERPRHGYEIAKLIGERSEGVLQFHVASLYPLLYRMEKRGWIKGQWVEKAGQRRRRYYKLTAAGQKVLAEQRSTWNDFFAALDRVARITPS
jgi:PadR family transcriptional regulator, regulatory protein PadR